MIHNRLSIQLLTNTIMAKVLLLLSYYKGDFVGLASLKHSDYQHNWEGIGDWICAYYSNNGVVNKVVQKLLEYGFVEKNLNQIEIRCAEKNDKSKAILKRLGFT